MELQTTEAGSIAEIQRREDLLHGNGYPGRWLALGRGEDENFFLAYSFGGRSDDSKNRRAILEGDAIRLVAPDKTPEEMAQVSDAALVYYHAMDSEQGVFVVSNGGQTRPVLRAIVEGATLEEAVESAPTEKGMMNGKEVDIDLSSFEPDPINTPRITGVIDLRTEAGTQFGLAVVRKDLITEKPLRTFYTADLSDIEPGQGWAIQTYGANDPDDKVTPVPHFTGPPYGFDMNGGADDIARRVQEAIGEQTFAAAVVRAIDTTTRQFRQPFIINTRGE